MPGCLELAAEESAGLLNDLNTLIDDFLCRVLRGEPSPWLEPYAKDFRRDFLRRSAHHGVQSLLYHRLRESGEWESWPRDVRLSLEQTSKAAIAQDMLRAHNLSKLLGQFANENIRCLLLKGEALAQTHYPVPGTRPRADADIFIGIRDLEKAQQAVFDAGFEIVSPVYKSHQFTARRSSDVSEVFEFDLHWRILNNSKYARVIGFEQAFEDSIALSDQQNTRVLGSVDALLLACLHRVASAIHDRNRLIWLLDIHLLASAMITEQWIEFSGKAIAAGVQEACRDGLSKSRECFCTVIPAEVIDSLNRPDPAHTLSRRFAQSNLALLIDDWWCLPGFNLRLKLLHELFFPSSESLLMKFGKSNRLWLPILYLRQVCGGFIKRLALK